MLFLVRLQLLGGHFDEGIGSETLWSLYGKPQGSIPHHGTENSEGPRHAEQHCVEAHLLHPVMLQGHRDECNKPPALSAVLSIQIKVNFKKTTKTKQKKGEKKKNQQKNRKKEGEKKKKKKKKKTRQNDKRKRERKNQ